MAERRQEVRLGLQGLLVLLEEAKVDGDARLSLDSVLRQEQVLMAHRLELLVSAVDGGRRVL